MKQALLIAGIFLFISQLPGQIPQHLEKELDAYNSRIYDALKILNTLPEEEALIKVAKIKTELFEEGESLSKKLERLPDLSADEEASFTQRQMEKPLYKDMVALMSSEEFQNKLFQSEALSREYDELMILMDLEFDSETAASGVSNTNSCSFTVGPGIPNSGLYTVSAEEGEAMGFSDDAGGITIEIYGQARGHEIYISLIVDEAKVGKYNWSSEGQIYIQSQDEEGNEIIQLQNYHEEGFIEIENLGNSGEVIAGNFKGLFFDDMGNSEKPLPVEGNFRVTRMESPY